MLEPDLVFSARLTCLLLGESLQGAGGESGKTV